ncbi:transcriptional regulator [Bacteroides helcogenes]|uniref:transcriptional regulator n=1 Tax=Bacteroides helcogenes TaxID=290053 RepID=UPI002A912F47|nr:transcriptional regulator [Bacteroides helcogenes]MDY5239450.1 transcriptional regulator [Bacteroides helcogenes]
MNKETSSLLFLLFLVCAPLRAGWQRPVTNYTRHIYKAGTQNWSIQQHDNGWMYVANNKGLLEFDGVEWNTYPIRNAKTRAVKMGHDGRIYIGGMGQFGYFTPNRLGGLSYTCLSDSLSPKTNVGIIWNILEDRDRVYFQSDVSFFVLNKGRVEKLKHPSEIQASLILKNRFYTVSSAGLMQLNGKNFQLLATSLEMGAMVKEGGLLPYGDKILLVSRQNGLFLYDGTAIRKFATAADDFCRKSQLFCAALKDSLLALGSIQEGVCLLNLKTGETEVVSIGNGLQDKTVLNMAFDREGQLWLGLDNGIDCIHLNARLASLYGGRAVVGAGYASCCYQGKFYLGTNQGLYRTAVPTRLNGTEATEFVAGTSGQIWSLHEFDGKLFCCSDNGIFIMAGEHMVQHIAKPRGVWGVVQVPGRTDVLIGGTYGSLFLLRKQGTMWVHDVTLKNFNHSCKEMLMEDASNLWVANKEDGVCRLTLSADLKEVVKSRYYNQKDFPSGYDACPALIDHEVVIASHYGIWHYDHARDSLEEYPGLEKLMDGKTAYTYLTVDSLHNIWYVANGSLKLLRHDAASGGYHRYLNEVFLRGSLIENFEDVHFCNRGQVIVGTEEGFSLIDIDRLRKPQPPLTLQIRKVYLTGQRDSLVYGRSYVYDDAPLMIPYSRNSLRIEYSANNYNRSQPTLYAYKLGNGSEEGKWSGYSENCVKEFTGLHEGKYVFSVRLLADHGQQPVITSFAFEVLPPWYRTWWSYFIYMAVFGLLVFYVYFRIAASRKRLLMKQELELYHKEQEFKQERDLQDRKIDSLQAENLQAELRHKSEELVQTTLNIVRKNEMLLDIKKEVLGISHSINEENLVALRRKTLRLLGKIDTNLEHDDGLQAFQSTFDSVHHDFFSKLEEAYPELSNKEKQLCAYITMNLLSKEIAPLMNLSLRGVEIGRFRLRKKLGLEEGENLAEFLQRFSRK